MGHGSEASPPPDWPLAHRLPMVTEATVQSIVSDNIDACQGRTLATVLGPAKSSPPGVSVADTTAAVWRQRDKALLTIIRGSAHRSDPYRQLRGPCPQVPRASSTTSKGPSEVSRTRSQGAQNGARAGNDPDPVPPGPLARNSPLASCTGSARPSACASRTACSRAT